MPKWCLIKAHSRGVLNNPSVPPFFVWTPSASSDRFPETPTDQVVESKLMTLGGFFLPSSHEKSRRSFSLLAMIGVEVVSATWAEPENQFINFCKISSFVFDVKPLK